MPDGAIEILIVEDNPNDLELTLHALKKYKIANRIQIARDGAEALDYLFETNTNGEVIAVQPPRLILLDLKLPKVDGLEVLQRIKADARTRTVPVVVMTSSREERDIVQSYQLGVNSFVTKPIDFSEFTEAIRQIGLYWMMLNEPPK
jgi:CheY-like chemotaxis protein